MVTGDKAKAANAIRDLKRVKARIDTAAENIATKVAQADAAATKMDAASSALEADTKEIDALLSDLGSNFGPELDELEVAPKKGGKFWP